MKINLLLLITLVTLSTTYAYHILCLSPVPSRSHNLLGRGIVNALLKAGHEVSWASPYPVKEPIKGLNVIDVSETIAIGEALDISTNHKPGAGGGMGSVFEFTKNISRAALSSPALKDALENKIYDAVVTEWFFSDYDAGYAGVLQVPWILLSGFMMDPHKELLVDEVRSIATLPMMMLNNAPVPMNLWQRLKNTFMYIALRTMMWYADNESVYKSFFAPIAAARGVSLPPFSSALHNISILLVNGDPSITPAQSLPPNVVQIAGYHIDENVSALAKDLQDLLDSSSQGVVYFSMGSILKAKLIPEHTRQNLIKMLGAIPYTVLWKFDEELKGLPKNIHIRSWMPQASILAHRNVKLFITHGGILSMLEALQNGVPLLAIPVFGDQPSNAERAVNLGFAKKVTFSYDMTDELEIALKELLANDSYYNRAKDLSKLFRNRPISPSKLIAYYVELAIETKGAHHLRSKSLQYEWYQLWMLDQVVVLAAVLYVIYKMLRKIINAIVNKVKGPSKKEKRN